MLGTEAIDTIIPLNASNSQKGGITGATEIGPLVVGPDLMVKTSTFLLLIKSTSY